MKFNKKKIIWQEYQAGKQTHNLHVLWLKISIHEVACKHVCDGLQEVYNNLDVSMISMHKVAREYVFYGLQEGYNNVLMYQ